MAFVAIMRATGKDVLVTDEAAAKVMPKIITDYAVSSEQVNV